MTDRTFKPPNEPPSHTGEMWRNEDGSIGGVVTDLFGWPVHFVAVKEESSYYIRGWRGRPPEFLRVPLIDDDVKPVRDT
jgi:hypothetical protein